MLIAVQNILCHIEHLKLLKETPLIGQLCEILKFYRNDVTPLVETVVSILFYITGEYESWPYEEVT
jgi:hypothetical protein